MVKVEAGVAIRMKLQGQQDVEVFCLEGDSGAEDRMEFHVKQDVSGFGGKHNSRFER